MRNRTTATLFFVDMLGVRSSWQKDGRKGAEGSFQLFQENIQQALLPLTRAEILDASIESDSAVFKCRNAEAAVFLALRLFRRTFARGSNIRAERRSWLRGVIIPISRAAVFRKEQDISRSAVLLKNFVYHRGILDAISIEKSGYRGMRCLIKSNLITDALRFKFRFMIGTNELPRFRHLEHSLYPRRIAKEFEDLLWMNPHDDISQWGKYQVYMANRLRYSGHNPDELSHAAATQIVFHECEAMIAARRRRI